MCWDTSETDSDCINLLDVEKDKKVQMETGFEIYDLTLLNDYVVFSGMNNKDFSYGIMAKQISTGKELCISDTQNNQLEFYCYQDEIYFLEPNDDNHLYKYNLSSKAKSKVSDLVQNKSSVRINLCVNDSGIFFTKCVFEEDSEETNLYKLDTDNNKVILIAQNIDDIVGSQDDVIYGIFNNRKSDIIYKINPDNLEKNEIFTGDEPIIRAYIQGEYLLCDFLDMLNEENDKTLIINLNNGKIIKTVTADV